MRKHSLRVTSQSGFKLEEIELLEIASYYFLTELDKIKPIGRIHGEITVVAHVLSEATNALLGGDMWEIKDHILDNGTKVNYYVCRIADDTNSAETLRTLAHELVHVWQSETGRLVTADNGETLWKGKSFGTHPYNGTDSDYLLPWEKEADKLDLKLTKKFYSTYFSNTGEIVN